MQGDDAAKQFQDALRRSQRSEETLQGIFGASPVALAVFVVEPGGGVNESGRPLGELVFVDVNEAWGSTTGHRREDTIGRYGAQLNLWMDPEVRRGFITQMREQGCVKRLEARMRRADGSEYFALVSGQDVLVNDERFHIVAIDDITAQKESADQLRSLNRQLNALLDAAVEVAIIATDPAGRITVFNHGAERMLGYSATEMQGEAVLRVHLPDDLLAHAQGIALQPGEPLTAERLYAAQTADGDSGIRNWILQRKDGSPVQVSTALSAVRDEQGRGLGYLGISRDISEQLAAQAEMIELNASLDRRVRERTLALQASKEQLEQTLEHLKQVQSKLVQSEKLASLASLVAAVAHELNTPIGNSVTVASTLRDNTTALEREMSSGQLRKQQLAQYLQEMQAGTALLERALHTAADLVSNFKRVAVDQGSENRRVFDARTVLQDTLAILRPTLKKLPYEMAVDLPEGIRMDSFPGALEQVIGNLVNNAVQHGFSGRGRGLMRLSARLAGEQLRIEFSDDGVGMSAETLARIYDPFFTTMLGRGGTGLGMHITYNLVTGPLGGEIEVLSRPEEGCSVSITLPLVAPGQPAASTIPG